MTDFNSHLQAAIREATRHRVQAFLALFEEHRRHKEFQLRDDAVRRELGFECCGKHVKVSLKTLRERLPEVQAFLRLREHRLRRGKAELRRKYQRARKRSKALLCRFLSQKQRWTLRARNWFEVTGQDGQTYKISRGGVHQGDKHFCLHADDVELPIYDTMLAHKLYIERQLEGFLDLAHVTMVNPKRLAPARPVPEEALDNPEPFIREMLR